MRTREELLKMANLLISGAHRHLNAVENTVLSPQYITLATLAAAYANAASACVALAKEMREDEEAPDYDQMQVIVNCLMSLTSGEKPQTPKE